MQPAILGQQASGPPTDFDGVATTVAGQPAELHGKHQDQQNANEKGGQGHAQQGKRKHRLGKPATSLERGVDPKRDAHHQCNQGSGKRQLQGGGQTLTQQAGNLLPLTQRQAKLTLRRIHHKMVELHGSRVVQPQLVTQLDAVLFGGVLAQHDRDRITNILKQDKSQ